MEVREPVPQRRARALALAGLLSFLGVWCVLSYADIIPTVILPSPTEVLRAFPVLHFEEALVRSAGWSLYRVGMGFILAALVAIPLGLLMGTFPAVKHFLAPLVDPLRFLPISALVPLFLVWFGIEEMMKIMLLFVGIFVYLLPLVEVCPGERTSADAVRHAAAVYTALGMRPLVLRREVDGLVADRLLEALWREALWLVNDEVATVAELDDAIRLGAGLRWAAMGTFDGTNANIYVNGTKKGSVTTKTWTGSLTNNLLWYDATGLTANTSYSIKVRSYDSSGAESADALMRLTLPGSTSCLPNSLGTQKLWITSTLSRFRYTGRSVGMCSSLAVTTPSDG